MLKESKGQEMLPTNNMAEGTPPNRKSRRSKISYRMSNV